MNDALASGRSAGSENPAGGPPIRIAYLIDTISTDKAGTQRQLLETIRRLDRGRFEPSLVCLWKSAWMSQNDLPCPCYVLHYRGFIKLNFPAVVLRLSRLLRDKRIDIVQTFFEDSIFVGFLGGFFAPRSIVLLSSRRDMGLGSGNQPAYHSLYARALPWVNRHFAGIIANCEAVKRYVARRERTSLGKIRVIRNGVLIPDRPATMPSLFNHDEDVVWIGLVASLTPVKRHDLLIEAIAELGRSGMARAVRLLLLGEGPERDSLVRQTRDAGLDGVVHFAGAVKNVTSYLYYLDIGVLCSDREGLSNAILEYMACGLPVVATAVGGNSELVDETNGICVPPGDPAALARALKCLIDDEAKRRKLGEGSLKKIERSFSWGRAMSDLEEYYLTLSGKPV